MELKSGAKLGPYEIVSRIGAGGMGEVWKARDTRLDRVVAIKTSAARFGERFEREARAVAALNHPHICTLYDVGPDYLVMEYVEGSEIEGPLPLDRALALAIQLAGALEAAHRKGITHRDLKPANILVTKAGIKVLDFGLAKFAHAGSAETNDTVTITRGLTQEGAIVGTLQYMAPEQLQGKQTDVRADFFSFGCVLYEMLTGNRAFEGSNAVSVIAAIMERPAPSLGDVAPASLDWALRRCLAKTPDDRWQSAGDLRAALEWVAEGGSETPARAASPHNNARNKAWMIAAGMCAVIAAGLAFIHFRKTPPEANAVNLSVKLPPDSAPGFLALSPDGRHLLVVGVGPGLYLRSLDSPELRPLPGTEGARVPFWSPDSRLVGFFADGKLKTIPLSGGPATVLCDQAGLGLGGTWNREGVILFSSGVLAAGPYGEGFLRRVNASGGACTAVTPGGQGTSDDTTGSIPVFLPDGNRFLYASSGAVYVASLDGMKRRKVLNDNSSALYASPVSGHGPGHVLFLRDASLMAQPFDTTQLAVTGEPFAVVSPLAASLTRPQMLASIADNGTLAWVSHVNRLKQLKWFDRTGTDLGDASQPGDYTGIALSPDGGSAVVGGTGQVSGGIWLFDFVRKSQTRLTAGERGAASGVWSPGGNDLVYASQHTLVLRDLNTASGREVNGEDKDVPLLPRDPDGRAPSDWSRDGHYLIYTQSDPKTGADIWYLPDPGKPGSNPVKFLGSTAVESQGQLSPDGHWLAYYTNEPGNEGVSIRPFPMGNGVWRVAAHAIEPRWNRDGKELFYRQPAANRANTLMAISIQIGAGSQIRFGDPHKLFSFVALTSFTQINAFGYAPTPDGKRFLVGVGAEGEKPELNIVLNWQKLIPSQAK